MHLRISATALVVLCWLSGTAFGLPCWNTVTPQNVVGFDFEISSVVEGPAPGGIYTYTYTLYRIDNGLTRYKGVSHISFWFPCGLDAQRSIIDGTRGITMTCREGSCPVVELGGRGGMSEPILDPGCRAFWGFKLDGCGAQGGYFLVPHIDQVSYPFDWMDPFCTITFKSRARPELGKWLVKGGVKDGDDGKSPLYDAGDIWVPTCLPVVSSDNMTWGNVKAHYR